MKDQIVSLAKDIIQIPSVVGDIPNLVKSLEVVKEQLTEYPFTPFVSNAIPSLLYSNKGKHVKNFKVLLYAHLDVVPAGHEQFKPYEKDGKLYGRGAYDMKAAAAAMVLLFKDMAREVSYPLGLQITTDEEAGAGKDGAAYQIAQGARADFVIAGECSSNFRIVNQAKGRLVVQITTKGHASHSAYAWLGRNAIWEMYEILKPIMDCFPTPIQETYETTVNITKIETTNEATNKIPDHCTAFIDVRYTEKDKDTIISTIQSLLPAAIEISIEYIHPPHFSNPNSFYIKQLQSSVKKVVGMDSPLVLAHGTSDTTHFSKAGCEAIEFGPIGKGNHHDEEWVDIQSLEDYYHILKNFLLQVEKETSLSQTQFNKTGISNYLTKENI